MEKEPPYTCANEKMNNKKNTFLSQFEPRLIVMTRTVPVRLKNLRCISEV
jgi:hypothetical protein